METSEQMTERLEKKAPQTPEMALIVAILLFVGLFVWGIVLSIAEQAQRGAPSDAPG